MPDIPASLLASRALALQRKLGSLVDEVHPKRRDALGPAYALLAGAREPVRERMAARLAPALIGPLPPLSLLAQEPASMSLLPGAWQRRALCMLALAGRPGVLRSCIDRKVRDGLRSACGSAAFAALAAASTRFPAASEIEAQYSPMHWALVGWRDWQGLLPPACDSLVRLVELSLPPMPAWLKAGPAALPPGRALDLLSELKIGWPC